MLTHWAKTRFRLARVILALLFGLTFGLQGLSGALTNAKVATQDMGMTMSAMSSDDAPVDCPSHDGVNQANCMAACAALTGIIFEPVTFALAKSRHAPLDERVASLRDRSILPEPHPPRPSTLI